MGVRVYYGDVPVMVSKGLGRELMTNIATSISDACLSAASKATRAPHIVSVGCIIVAVDKGAIVVGQLGESNVREGQTINRANTESRLQKVVNHIISQRMFLIISRWMFLLQSG